MRTRVNSTRTVDIPQLSPCIRAERNTAEKILRGAGPRETDSGEHPSTHCTKRGIGNNTDASATDDCGDWAIFSHISSVCSRVPHMKLTLYYIFSLSGTSKYNGTCPSRTANISQLRLCVWSAEAGQFLTLTWMYAPDAPHENDICHILSLWGDE